MVAQRTRCLVATVWSLASRGDGPCWGSSAKRHDPCAATETPTPAPHPLPDGVGLVYRVTHPDGRAYFPIAYDLPGIRRPAPSVGRAVTFPPVRLSHSRMAWGASADRIAWNQTLAHRGRAHPVCLRDRARSMLQRKHGAPSGAFVACGGLHLFGQTRARRLTPGTNVPDGAPPKKEGNHERACHPPPRRLFPLGAVLHCLAV